MKGIWILAILGLMVWSPQATAQESEAAQAYRRSFQFESAQDYRRAASALMPLWEKYPQGYTLNLRLGWLYYRQNQQANAIEHYTKAVQAFPLSLEARLGLSLPYLAQSRWSEAEQILAEVLKRDYYNFYGNLRLSRVYRAQQKPELAEQVITRILYSYPANTLVLFEWGAVLSALGRTQEARRVLGDLLVLDPENPAALKLLNKLPAQP